MSPTSLPSRATPDSGGVQAAPAQVAVPACGPVPAPGSVGNDMSGRRARVIGGIVGAHSVIDYFSFIVVALLPLLAARLELTNFQKAMLLGSGSIMGLIQPLVAWIGDRHNTRIIATIGFVVGVAACSTLGLAQNFWQLLVLSVIGSAGVNAFHPPAAAVIGQMAGARRALGVSLFFVAGMLGGMAGNVVTPYLVRWMGGLAGGQGEAGLTLGLQWQSALIVPGVLVAVVLARAIHDAPHRTAGADREHAALPEDVRRLRWRAVWILYAASVTRFTVNAALVYLFVRWIETLAMERAGATQVGADVGIAASVLNGKFQAAMQLGMGGAGLTAGWLLAKRHEKASLVVVPLAGALTIAAIPFVDDLGLNHGGVIALGLALAVLTGVGFGGTVPTVIALAQRLLPHRTTLASGMMMGGAWGLAFVGPPIAEQIERRASLDTAFFVTAALLTVCAGFGAMLPGRVLREA